MFVHQSVGYACTTSQEENLQFCILFGWRKLRCPSPTRKNQTRTDQDRGHGKDDVHAHLSLSIVSRAPGWRATGCVLPLVPTGRLTETMGATHLNGIRNVGAAGSGTWGRGESFFLLLLLLGPNSFLDLCTTL